MPGIYGVIDLSNNLNTDEIVAKACRMLNPKGLYKVCKQSFSPNVTIARVYLDMFNRDPQPFYDESGEIAVFLEGEVYLPITYDKTVRNTQLRYIVDVYKSRGLKFSYELNGSFLVVIHDARNNSIVISTDRTASRPLYYAISAGALFLSPEIKAILPNMSFGKGINETALALFLTNGYLIGEHTYWEGIKSLEPATNLEIDLVNGSIKTTRYWEFLFDDNVVDHGSAYFSAELSQLLKQAVGRAASGGYRIAVPLSGGVDSRAVLYSCLEALPRVSAVTWGVTSDKKDSDALIAQRLCKELGVDHRFLLLDISKLPENAREWVIDTEGMIDEIGLFPGGLEIYSLLSRDFDVLLRGDQCFSLSNDPVGMSFHIYEWMDRQLKGLLRKEVYERLEQQYIAEIEHLRRSNRSKNDTDAHYHHFLYSRVSRHYSPLSHYKSRIIEQRYPLLDNEILDFTRRLPVKYRLNKQFWTMTVLETFPDLPKFKWAVAHNLPDWDKNFRQDKKLQNFIVEILSGKNGNDDAFFTLFDRDQVKSFAKYCIQTESASFSMQRRLNLAIRSSGIWRSQFGRFLREKMVRQVLKERRHVTPAHVLMMRLLILRIWFNDFHFGLE